MAKQIVITCDPCADAGRAGVSATPRELPTDLDHHKRLVVVDMCDDCDKELLEPVRVLLREHGQTSHAPAPTPRRGRPPKQRSGRYAPAPVSASGEQINRSEQGAYLCPFDNCRHADRPGVSVDKLRPLIRRPSMRAHLHTKHDVELFDAEEQYGNLNHIDEERFDGLLTKHECRWCDAKFPAAQARGKHESEEHAEQFYADREAS